MAITLSNLTIPLDGKLSDLCYEIQKTGIVVAIVYGDMPRIRLYPESTLPVLGSRLVGIQRFPTTGDEEYTYESPGGTQSVIYGKEASDRYHPPVVVKEQIPIMYNLTVTFDEDPIVFTFIHLPRKTITTPITF